MRFARIQAVAFDAVGTLIEPWPPVARAYRQAAAEQGLDLPEEVIRHRFGKAFSHDETSGGYRTDEALERVRWRRIVGECLPELTKLQADAAFEQLWDHFADATKWRLFEDVEQVVKQLSEMGLKLCVASNFDSRLRQVWSGLVNSRLPLQSFVISSEVGARKPGSKFYQAVADKLGHAPHETLFVGDDLVNDYQSPMNFGFRPVLIDRKDRFDTKSKIKTLGDLVLLCESID